MQKKNKLTISSLWENEDMKINKAGILPGKQITRKHTDIDNRNDTVTTLMQNFFTKAESDEYIQLDSSIQEVLDATFHSRSWGFREILLLVVLARLLNEKYKGSVDFYACNPRALYEGPIRTTLRE